MKENKSTGHKSTFLASLCALWDIFWPYWVWAKKCLYFGNQIKKKKLFYHLKLNLVLQTISLLPHYPKNTCLGIILQQMCFLQLGSL